jgi:hypothetical protein
MDIRHVDFEEVNTGDVVYFRCFGSERWNTLPMKVLAKHQGVNDTRKYVVAAYMGDIPTAQPIERVGKEYRPKVKLVKMYGNPYKYAVFNECKQIGDTHSITYNFVDDVLDCASVKMERL